MHQSLFIKFATINFLKMKTLTFILSALFGVCSMQAQITAVGGAGGGGGNNTVVSYLLGDIKSGDQKRKAKENNIQGSAYTSEVFLPGKLFYKGEYQSDIFYRYNAYAEEIEIKDVDISGAPVRGLNRDKEITVLTADGRSFSFTTFIDKKGLTQNGYLTKLVDGKYSLYKRYDVKYTQGQKAQNSFVKATPPRFSKFTEYYMSLEGRNRIDEVEFSNRKFLKLVEESQQAALKQHFKDNGIKLKKESDVLNILNHLNQ